jgi:hypothetical protein
MTPTEYRQFCETTYCAPASVDREEYLRLLLIEEVGEVASLFAKAMRDGHVVDMSRLEKELGDVMWAAVMFAQHGIPSWWSGYAFGDLSRALDLTDGFAGAQNLCKTCGFDPEQVALANVEKLKSRQARGVLHGSGDER